MCEIKCPETRKKLTTQNKSCLMDEDAKRPGVGSMRHLRTRGWGRLLWMAPNMYYHFCNLEYCLFAQTPKRT